MNSSLPIAALLTAVATSAVSAGSAGSGADASGLSLTDRAPLFSAPATAATVAVPVALPSFTLQVSEAPSTQPVGAEVGAEVGAPGEATGDTSRDTSGDARGNASGETAGETADDTGGPLELEDTVHGEFAAKDTWRWYVHGGFGADIQNIDNTMVLGGIGATYFIADGLSLSGEVNGIYVSQQGDDAGAVNFALVMTWHFYRGPGWSAYLDGGAGLWGSSSRAPREGTEFNFTPQLGAGFTIALDPAKPDTRLMMGLRWYHISNANTARDNPGRDHALGYVGMSFPF